MIEVSPSYLLSILDENTAKKVWRHLRGCRIYFPKCKSLHDEIRSAYKDMELNRAEAVKRLSIMFDKSESQIRIILREQGGLFEGD